MPAIIESNLLQSLGWALINSLWQMALLWVVYLLINFFFTSIKSDKKVNLAMGFLVFGFGWFTYTFFITYFTASSNNSANSIAELFFNSDTLRSWTNQILPITSIIYLFILIIPVWQFIRNYRYVQLIRHKGLLKIDADWRMFVKRLKTNMGINRQVEVWLSTLVQSAVTIGYLKPVILLPIAAVNHLSTSQVEAILLHELSHIRRYDYVFNLIIHIIRSILYFNPFVRAFARIVEREREISCDQMVIHYQYQPSEYASALLMMQRATFRTSQMMMAAAGNNNLLNRVETILGIRRKDNFRARRLIGAITVLFCMISMNAVLFINAQKDSAGFPGFAQGYNPYHFMMADNYVPPVYQNTNPTIKKDKAKVEIQDEQIATVLAPYSAPVMSEETPPPHFYNVNNITEIIPVLDAYDEAKLKGTLQATRKILEEKEWKEVEKSYAELLNTREKSYLKDQYLYEVNNFDWKKLEAQLRLSYDQIDWNRIDEQVNSSLSLIRLDSLKIIITKSLTDLKKLECWMKENNETAIPDTDITLHSLHEAQQKTRTQLDRVRSIKTKKIVRL